MAPVLCWVFSPELDVTENVCNTHAGDVKLTCKESKRTTPAEETVDEKIKAMIAEMMKVGFKDITIDESGYTVNIPLKIVLGNQAILDMHKHKDRWQRCWRWHFKMH